MMETLRQDHERTYGGKWQIVRDPMGPVSEGDMLRRRAELRPTPRTQSGPMSKLMATITSSIEQAHEREGTK